jgi:hypoxanthine phosphoribosyltransferase
VTAGGDTLEPAPADSPASHPPLDEIGFAHGSERIAAEILDFYRIRWEYEPRAFPLEWDGKGVVIASFTPDFYLPEFDLYIELTTMSQKLVTKKNRKVRRLKELYPDVNIKIFYQKDFRRLLARFGVPSQPVPHADGGGVVASSPGGETQ